MRGVEHCRRGFNPGEASNSIDDPDYADVLADLRARLVPESVS
jgi:hypothetical protein